MQQFYGMLRKHGLQTGMILEYCMIVKAANKARDDTMKHMGTMLRRDRNGKTDCHSIQTL